MRRFLPKIFILLVIFSGVGFFDVVKNVHAAGDEFGTCTTPSLIFPYTPTIEPNVKEGDCLTGAWVGNGSPVVPAFSSEKTDFENKLQPCGVNPFSDGCLEWLFYRIFHDIPALILLVTGYFFNILISVSLSGELLKSSFVSAAWGIVRDLSNIFFILILLYISIKIILGLAGHEVKQTIVKVIVMALLINFSMFFTNIIIDTSNIVALIFYNKLEVVIKNPDGSPRQYSPIGHEINLSGGLVSAFDPTKMIGNDFFQAAQKQFDSNGHPTGGTRPVPVGMLLAIILLSGAIMSFAAYALFISGFAFLGRLIELWLLIIASPFAFMSWSIHEMESMEDWGWKAWLHRVLTTSFMAPGFMVILYLIFMLISSPIFAALIPRSTDNGGVTGWMKIVLGVVLPSILICVLLIKSVKLAKKGSGQFGEGIMSATKLLGGLGLGLASGGVALAGRATVGAFMKSASTGDSINQRFARGETRGLWDNLRGGLLHYGTLGTLTAAQRGIGRAVNRDQHNVEHAAHARHDLDTEAGVVAHGKKWDQLNGEQRALVRRNIARKDAMRAQGYGNRAWNQLTNAQQSAVNTALAVSGNVHHAVADTLINDARRKQGILSSAVQSTVTGTYDIRNLAEIVAKEQTTGFAKLAASLTGGVASGMRGALKQMGVNYGKAEGKFFKDLGSTISEALKNAKINVDLSHVGEVKKEGSHGGGGHH